MSNSSDVLPVPHLRPGTGNHVCWSFRGRSAFAAGARTLVAEGLDRNERVAIAGPNPPEVLTGLLDGVDGAEPALATGQLVLADDSVLPGADPHRDPVHELAALDAMTRDAVRSGYRGLRVVADVVHRVVDPVRREGYLGVEHLFDRFCLEHPFTAVCSYDVEVLGPEPVALLACMHRSATPELSSFHLGASINADLALSGSLDGSVVDDLRVALSAVGPFLDGPVRVDVSELEFINHGALIELDRFGAARGRAVELLGWQPSVQRLADMLPLTAIRLVP